MPCAIFKNLDESEPVLRRFSAGGTTGLDLSSLLSRAADRYLLSLLDRELGADMARDLVVVATGGYGRQELFPFSDLDLTFLVEKHSAQSDEKIKRIIYLLWDAQIAVGYSIRTPQESIALAIKDIKVLTSLIDSRVIFGNAAIYELFRSGFVSSALAKNEATLVNNLIIRRETRRKRLGDSVYFLEPDLKESRGGIRDYNTALWLAKSVFGVSGFEGLLGREVLKASTLTSFHDSLNMLFDIRHRLKLLNSLRNDRFTFELQDRIAVEKGFLDPRGKPDTEKLMSAYYRAAEVIESFCDLMQDKSREWLAETAGKAKSKVKRIDKVFGKNDVNLVLLSGKEFAKNPSNILRAFALAHRHNIALHEYLKESILDYFGKRAVVEWKGDAVSLFREVFKSKGGIYETLSLMHKTGALEGVIPEFGNIKARIQRDIYHRYTVDKHSLITVGEIEKLEKKQFLSDFPVLSEIMASFDRGQKNVLYLAALLHDIGKGSGQDHSVEGKKIAGEVGPRLGLSKGQVATLEFLVGNHLLMSITAQRRNLDDPVMISKFTSGVTSLENLKLLYVLSWADIRSVAHDGVALTPWKGQLLGELYRKSLELLSIGSVKRWVFAKDISRFKRKIASNFGGRKERKNLKRYMDSMPEGYFRSFGEKEICAHYMMIEDIGNKKYSLKVSEMPQISVTKLTMVTGDFAGLFAALAGAFSAARINILNSVIFSSGDGWAVDTFVIQGADGKMVGCADRRLTDFEAYFRMAAESRAEFDRLLKSKHKPANSILSPCLPKVDAQVDFDIEGSRDFSILEVYAQDRVGLLYDLASLLTDLKLDIHFAKISTEGSRAQDIFYLTDLEKKKISDMKKLHFIKDELLKML